MVRRPLLLLAAALVAALYPQRGLLAAPTEKLPAGARVTLLEAHPERIVLDNPFAYAQLVIGAHLAGGEVIDASRMVEVVAPEKLVRVSSTGQVRAVADG